MFLFTYETMNNIKVTWRSGACVKARSELGNPPPHLPLFTPCQVNALSSSCINWLQVAMARQAARFASIWSHWTRHACAQNLFRWGRAWHGPLCMRGTTKWCTNPTQQLNAPVFGYAMQFGTCLLTKYISTYVIRMSYPSVHMYLYVRICLEIARCSLYLCNWPTKLARVRSTEKLKLKSKLHFVRHQFYSLLDSPLFLHTSRVHFDSSLCAGMPKLRL